MRHLLVSLCLVTTVWAQPPALKEALAAAAQGDAPTLKAWLDRGGDPNQADAEGWTPLLLASVRGKAQAVKILLHHPRRPADPAKAFAPSGALPIHMAGHSGSVETAALLLAARPQDLDAVWLLNGHTLLLQAAFYGHLELAAFALQRGANPAATTLRGFTASDLARQFDNQALLKITAPKEASKEAAQTYYQALLERVRERPTPGQEAAQARADALVEALASSLQQVAQQPEQGDALFNRITELAQGTDPNRLGGPLRQPPLVVAVTGNNLGEAAGAFRLRVARWLLDQGASPLVYERHPMGANAFIRASVFGHLDILKAMAARVIPSELAAAFNERPAVNGLTALHDAVLRAGTAEASHLPRYLQQLRWEVACGARSDIEDFAGRTQTQYAEAIPDPDRRRTVLEALSPGFSTPQWNHTAFGVPHLEEAVTWYQQVFGFTLIGPFIEVQPGSQGGHRERSEQAVPPVLNANWSMAQALFGPDITHVRIARLRVHPTLLNVLELFEVKPSEPPAPQRRSGPLHACLVVGEQLESTVERLELRGGRLLQRGERPGVRIVFCTDPWGNTLELVSKPW